MNKEKAAKIAVALFFAGLMIAGIFTCDYGVTPPEGEKGAAMLFDLLAGWMKLEKTARLWQVYMWLWFVLGAWAVYGFSRETEMSRPVGCMGALMLCLCPCMFARGHYDAEMAILTIVLWLLWLGVRFAKKPGLLRGVWLILPAALLVWFGAADGNGEGLLLAEQMVFSLPLYVLPLAAMGELVVIWRIWEQRRNFWKNPVTLALIAASLCWMIPLALFSRASHALAASFAYAGILLLAARGVSGMYRFGRHFGGDCGMHLVLLAGLVLFFGWTARDIARNHPYQYVYFNRLGHETAARKLVLDEEGLSAAQALNRLREAPRNERLRLTVGVTDEESLPGLQKGHAMLDAASRKSIRISKRMKENYLFSDAGSARKAEQDPPKGYHELLELQSYGFTLCTIYEKD